MISENIDRLVIQDNQVIFINAAGTSIEMPNLTALIDCYKESKGTPLGDRIEEILSLEIGDLLIAEVMIDMTNETTQERLRTGEISKNLKHVQTYNIILDSHMEKAKKEFKETVLKEQAVGQFEDCFFAQFPYGMVIMRDMFKTYSNTVYCKKDIEELIA